jgi:hypothetical protein
MHAITVDKLHVIENECRCMCGVNVLMDDVPASECVGSDCIIPGLIDGNCIAVGARAALAALILSASSLIFDASRRS